ncbi:MAG: bifunctional nuclease family protein, partial [Flavobacteriales bacterium]|nr:bifunctional nuclease family protein [Flavobacteriales bacterium]
MIIGGVEAQAIAIQVENIKPARPLTHDLFKHVADTLGFNLKEGDHQRSGRRHLPCAIGSGAGSARGHHRCTQQRCHRAGLALRLPHLHLRADPRRCRSEG